MMAVIYLMITTGLLYSVCVATQIEDTIPHTQVKLLHSWKEKIKNISSIADGYTAKVEKFCQLKERVDSWFDPLSEIETKTMNRLREQIGGDVNIRASDIRYKLSDLTEKLLQILNSYVSNMENALYSGDIDIMKMTQYNLPVSIADVLLEYQMRNWRDELQKAQIDNPSSENHNAMGRMTVYHESYQQGLITVIISMGYNAIVHLLA
ncbi:uncharacterized protein [Dysidea avara]|uniref:uncharacterized protein n=1 Tax=Dysidea avara TaxID=196820 RepID=UPI00332150D6